MDLTLSEELFSLALDGEGRQMGNSQRLDVALAGGWILDLVLLGRIDVPDKKVDVLDTTLVGRPELDAALNAMSQRRRRKAYRWLLKLRNGARFVTARRLSRLGVVRQAEKRVLGLFPVKRYPLSGCYSPESRRARLEQVLAGAEGDTVSVSLLTLIYAAKLDRDILPGVRRREAKKRLPQLTQEAGISDAVRRAVQSIESATAAAGAGGGGGDGGGG